MILHKEPQFRVTILMILQLWDEACDFKPHIYSASSPSVVSRSYWRDWMVCVKYTLFEPDCNWHWIVWRYQGTFEVQFVFLSLWNCYASIFGSKQLESLLEPRCNQNFVTLVFYIFVVGWLFQQLASIVSANEYYVISCWDSAAVSVRKFLLILVLSRFEPKSKFQKNYNKTWNELACIL
jgi:hypothetical protein